MDNQQDARTRGVKDRNLVASNAENPAPDDANSCNDTPAFPDVKALLREVARVAPHATIPSAAVQAALPDIVDAVKRTVGFPDAEAGLVQMVCATLDAKIANNQANVLTPVGIEQTVFAVAGDPTIWARMRPCRGGIEDVVMRVTKDPAAVEVVVNKTFLVGLLATRQLPSTVPTGAYRAWLIRDVAPTIAAQWINAINFERKIADIRPSLGKFIHRMLRGDSEAVEDCVQMTCLRVSEARHRYSDASSFNGWVFRIARHVVLDYCGSASRRKNLVNAAAAALKCSMPVSEFTHVEQAVDLNRDLQHLATELRQNLVWRQKGLSLRERGELFGGLTENQVSGLEQRAFQRLRQLNPQDLAA